MKESARIPYTYGCILLLFAIKISWFYELIEINHNYGAIWAATNLLFIFLQVGIAYFFKKKGRHVMGLIYGMISIVLLCDIVYFQYFHQLPSLSLLSQINQLSGVKSSVGYLIQPYHWLFILDTPIVSFFIWKKKWKDDSFVLPISIQMLKDKKVIGVSLWILAMLLSKDNLFERLIRQELFLYHFHDMYRSTAAQSGSGEFDELFGQLLVDRSDTTADNGEKKYFGTAKDRNLIVIQIESLQNFVINRKYNGQEITPNLNKLLNKDSIYFDRYYQQLGRGNTSDAEFVSNNSLHPSMDGGVYERYGDHEYYGLPWLLRDHGYRTMAMHGHDPTYWNREKALPKQGFEIFHSDSGYTIYDYVGFGLTDKDFFQQSLPYLQEIRKPFYAFLITLTSHHPYVLPEHYDTIQLKKEHKNTLFGNYLRCIHYTDTAIGEFIKGLRMLGLYDDSMIAIYGDHYGLSSKHPEAGPMVTEFLGYPYDFDEMFRIPLIFHIPNTGITDKRSVAGGQIDFMPTVLNLMGLTNEKGIMLGRDLNNALEGFVAEQTYMVKGSFIDDQIAFEMSRDGIFENSRAWNLETGTPIDIESCRSGYQRAIQDINRSDYILRNNLVKEFINKRKKQ